MDHLTVLLVVWVESYSIHGLYTIGGPGACMTSGFERLPRTRPVNGFAGGPTPGGGAGF